MFRIAISAIALSGMGTLALMARAGGIRPDLTLAAPIEVAATQSFHQESATSGDVDTEFTAPQSTAAERQGRLVEPRGPSAPLKASCSQEDTQSDVGVQVGNGIFANVPAYGDPSC